MNPFLDQVVGHLLSHYTDFRKLVVILPSNRSIRYLHRSFAQYIKEPIVLPKCVSIENFISEVSGLKTCSAIEVLLKAYDIYQNDNNDKISFQEYATWGNMVMNDFDELDRYLVDEQSLFDTIEAIGDMKAWSVDKENSPSLLKNYQVFIRSLKPLYVQLTKELLNKGQGYQGLRYRHAVSRMERYMLTRDDLQFVFVGFNALNRAEEKIITAFLNSDKAELFWDIDPYFRNDEVHDANHFIKRHVQKWKGFKDKMHFSKDTSYTEFNKIEITGVPKSISQAKYIGNLIRKLQVDASDKPIAVVLADESLLLPVLHSLPREVQNINVTMGYPLGNTSIGHLIEILMVFLLKKSDNSWSTNDVLPLIKNNLFKIYIERGNLNFCAVMEKRILDKDVKRVSVLSWNKLLSDSHKAFITLLNQPSPTTSDVLAVLYDMVSYIQPKFSEQGNHMEAAAIDAILAITDELKEKEAKHTSLRLLKDAQYIFQELIAAKKIDLRGDAFKGIQIMGMLETRVLDFETVIIASVNEGILPAGKVQNSFIPFDVKSAYGLPTYKDKDAVYTYHFYRLLQRAKQIFMTYNTEPDVLEGGERSRLISQLLTDENLNASITHTIAAPDIVIERPIKYQVTKTAQVMAAIAERGINGFSPTSLSAYISNPYEFYKRYILGIEEIQGKSETIVPNIFGTIIHDSLELLYTPFIGQKLHQDDIALMRSRVKGIVKAEFKKSYSTSSIEMGQNLIVYQVLLKYIAGVLDFELEQLKNHEITILALEKDLKVCLDVPNMETPVYLKGKLDRIDEIDGNLRILDYKTGLVKPTDLQITDYSELVDSDKKSKAFQLLSYALMFLEPSQSKAIKAGILPIKNLQKGVLYFTLKSSGRNQTIDSDLLAQFSEVLIALISNLFDTAIPFRERED